MSAAYVLAAAVLAAAAAATVSLAAGPSPGAPDEEVTGLVSISIFLAAFLPLFITLLFLACLYVFGLHDDANPPGEGAGASVELSGRGTGGLDAAAIAELPLVVYRDVRQHRIVEARDGDDALECSVCLHEFGDDDQLRLLPRCSHAFHPNCIAIWLEGHATCPLCRASLLDAPLLEPLAPLPPDGAPNDPTVLLIGDASDREEEEDEVWSRFQLSVRNRPLALPRSNSTGHDGDSISTARFTLQLPEHVLSEIHRSHRLRHVTSAVESVRVSEGSGYGSAVARLLTRFAPGAGRNGDDKSGKADAAGEEKRSD